MSLTLSRSVLLPPVATRRAFSFLPIHGNDGHEEEGGCLLVEYAGPSLVLTLNRPRKRNALSPLLVDRLLEAVDGARDDGRTQLLVIRGEGSATCAGFDFAGVRTQTDADLLQRFVRIELLLQAVRHAPFATLALARGPCYGAGADLVAACSHRVADPGATFRMPGLKFGVVLGTRSLAASVGTDTARALLETSKVFTATEALDYGFITGVADEAEWPAVVQAAEAAATALTPEAQRAMLHQTHMGGVCAKSFNDSDLAALVRSAAVPGLQRRIIDFLENKP